MKYLKYFLVSLEMGLEKTADQPMIWIIDRQQWPRAYLRAELIERGYDVIGFIELSQAVAALDDATYPKPRLIILEFHDLSFTQEELDTLTLTGVPIIALGGAGELNEKWVRNFKWAAVVRRPFTIGKVADVAEELLARRREKINA